jgi:hypothetical protein
MADMAVFQGSLVNLKNSPTHKSVVLQVEVPEEYGEAIVRAFGWPTRVKPLPVAVARLEGDGEQLKQPERRPEHVPFYDLTPAQQAGIVCKDPEFAEFLRSAKPYSSYDLDDVGWQPEDLVRDCCGVKSRADIKEGTEAHRQWRIILNRFREWQDERDRADPGF